MAVSLENQAAFRDEVLAELNEHPFRPPVWLRNPHTQTAWAPFFRRRGLPPMRLERWDTLDGDFLRLQFLDGDSDSPTALLLHGLEGSVESPYIAGLVNLFREVGWNVAVLEFRSCGGEMNRARRMYHSGETTDAAFVVDRLIERNPDIAIYMAGFSLGGNVTAKWLGEMGDRLPHNVKAGAVVSAPFDLLTSSPYMDRGIRRLYVYRFLRTLIPKSIEKEKQFPGCVDIERVKRSRTFADFDTYATAALHGFRDAEDYYTQVACGQYLGAIRRPMLLLSAADDPFNPRSTIPWEQVKESPYLHGVFPDKGGHVGFVHGASTFSLSYWAEEQIVRFFRAYARIYSD